MAVFPAGYAWATWLTMLVKRNGSRSAAGTMRGASSAWCRDQSNPEVSSHALREARRQALS